jgi:hypothetical protein
VRDGGHAIDDNEDSGYGIIRSGRGRGIELVGDSDGQNDPDPGGRHWTAVPGFQTSPQMKDRPMERMFTVETTLTGGLAELYASVLEEFERMSEIPLSEVNRTLLQTGVIQHLVMMRGLGLLDEEKADLLETLIEKVAGDTIMWELIKVSQRFWEQSQGSSGSVNLEA